MKRSHVFTAIRIAVLLVVLLGVAYTFLIIHVWGLTETVPQISFVAKDWKLATPVQQHRTIRSWMVDDLLKTHNFKGWTRVQVKELLGEPTPKTGMEPWDWVYYLGLERGGAFSLDDEFLAFEFDENGKVTSWRLIAN